MIKPVRNASEIRNEILEDMGRNCAKSLNWAEKYKNNPEVFFAYSDEHSGENISFNEEKKKTTVITRERDFDCPIVIALKLRHIIVIVH